MTVLLCCAIITSALFMNYPFNSVFSLHSNSIGRTYAIPQMDKAYAEAISTANLTNNNSENLPYLLDYSSLTPNSSSALNFENKRGNSSNSLSFTLWGNGNLHLSQTSEEKSITLLKIKGSTKDQAAGFISKNLNFKGRYVLLYIANITKPENAQLSFTFTIKDGLNEYHLIFVNGPLNIQGWKNSNYYEKIDAASYKLIDLKKLMASYTESYALEKITIVISKGISLSADFRINLAPQNESIINTGHIQRDRYIFHDLTISRSVKIDYQIVSNDYDIVNNGWIITGIKEWKDDNNGLMNITIVASKPSKSLSQSISKLDISESMLNLSSKDSLFLLLLLVPVLVYPYRMVKI